MLPCRFGWHHKDGRLSRFVYHPGITALPVLRVPFQEDAKEIVVYDPLEVVVKRAAALRISRIAAAGVYPINADEDLGAASAAKAAFSGRDSSVLIAGQFLKSPFPSRVHVKRVVGMYGETFLVDGADAFSAKTA